MPEVTVTGLGAAGDGLARLPDGTPCFVAGGLPGERLAVRVTERRRGAARAEIAAVLAPSPARALPPCRHFAEGCGGCAVQHLAAAEAAAWKRDSVAEALRRGGFADPVVAATATSPPRSRRRADLALRRGPGGVAAGFHRRGSGAVLDLVQCEVLDPRLFALLAPLRALLRDLPALRREGSAVLNLLDTGADLLLRTDGALEAEGRAALADFAAAHGLPRIAWARGDGPPEPAAQLGPVSIALGGVAVAPPPGAFLQATPEGEAAILGAVLAGLPERLPGKARIADLYAGLGTLSFPLAGAARVAAFEGSAEAVAALSAAAGRAGARVAATRRDLARQPLTPAELAGFAAVVLDPPFAGAAEQIAPLARARVPRVIYVSCNPAALTRDARALAAAGYRLVSATPVDQFLWSAQVEAVAVFAV